MTDKPRTGQQNKALHKGFEMVAASLNGAGLDMRQVLRPEVNIPWTKSSVKEHLYKPIMRLMYAKEHTADLSKSEEPGAVWETMMRFLMENHHIEYIDFPSEAPGYTDTAPMHRDREEGGAR